MESRMTNARCRVDSFLRGNQLRQRIKLRSLHGRKHLCDKVLPVHLLRPQQHTLWFAETLSCKLMLS